MISSSWQTPTSALVLVAIFLRGVEASCSPPTQYQLEDDGLYYFYPSEKQTYNEARELCELDGATLAIFENEEEYNVIATIVGDGGGIHTWVGLLNLDLHHCLGPTCPVDFYWPDGRVMPSQSYWSKLDANDQSPCMRMLKNGDIGDRPCSQKHKYLCQYDCNHVYPVTQTCPDAGPMVPSGYNMRQEPVAFYYRMFANGGEENLGEMANTCLQDGAQLAQFKTQGELATLKGYAAMAGQVYVGLQRTSPGPCANSACDTKVRWVDTSDFAYDNAVMDLEVTSANEESCFKLVFDDTTPFVIQDEPCHSGLHFVCKFSCPGEWSEWSSWSSCSNTCGYGYRRKTRSCSVPGGCEGPHQNIEYCVDQPCPSSVTQEITFTYHRVGLNTLNNLVANMKSWGKANAITCASFCAKMRKTDEDFTKCNAFVLDTS